ncbi:uncharacterized protein A4U43_C04F16990 [Asparagus officinalis]|uniref:Uncharacterized protein n=1 Tax=Asparagus officinalis TaxID=4686 RepID=A0A5P1F6B4_ASPOF|nr:uncharacterized protein A4U43_C04F16990 [Asparagus officinalis]
MKRFSVTRNTSELVSPSEPTPSVCLPLSAIDNTPHLNRYFEMLKVYRHGHDPAKVIKEAISKTLVPYYPVAGNVRRSERGELEIDCSTGNGGVCFVEGSADCTLEDVNYFVDQPPLLIPMEQLVPSTPIDQELRKPVLSLQP